jgi:regulatory protein
VVVFLDGERAFDLAAPLAGGLEVGAVLSDGDVAELLQQDSTEDAYQRALRLVSLRQRSEGELRSYYNRHRIPETVQEAAIFRLREIGLLDDGGFARAWVENRQTFRPRSRRALRAELRGKGVSGEEIEASLADVDDHAAALQVARRAARRWMGESHQDFARHMAGHLARRGFDYTLIRSVVEQVRRETTSRADESEGVPCNSNG